jgi:hypothetical protein
MKKWTVESIYTLSGNYIIDEVQANDYDEAYDKACKLPNRCIDNIYPSKQSNIRDSGITGSRSKTNNYNPN